MANSSILIVIPGRPRAQPRGRHVGRRRPVSIFHGDPAARWALNVERAGRQAVLNLGGASAVGQILGTTIELEAQFDMPTKVQSRWGKPHTAKPDGDNLVKLVMDRLRRVGALGGKDDCAIARHRVTKTWAEHGRAVVILKRASEILAKSIVRPEGRAPSWLTSSDDVG